MLLKIYSARAIEIFCSRFRTWTCGICALDFFYFVVMAFAASMLFWVDFGSLAVGALAIFGFICFWPFVFRRPVCFGASRLRDFCYQHVSFFGASRRYGCNALNGFLKTVMRSHAKPRGRTVCDDARGILGKTRTQIFKKLNFSTSLPSASSSCRPIFDASAFDISNISVLSRPAFEFGAKHSSQKNQNFQKLHLQ